MAELLAFLDLEKTRFTKRIFSIFDEDGSGLIDFREFVLSLWNYCTLTKVRHSRASISLFMRCDAMRCDITRRLLCVVGAVRLRGASEAK